MPFKPTKEMLEAGEQALDDCVDEDYSSDADGNRYPYTTIRSDAVYRVWVAMATCFLTPDRP